MIDRIALSRSGLVTSRLGFGTSRLHHSDSKTRALLLETAVDLGLTHIDTAPAYGDTLAEREIGNVLRGKRDRLVIATKYGIPPDPLVSAVPFLAFPLRAGRTILRKAMSRDAARPLMTPRGLRVSLEHSLRHLRTDWVDLLLLHEPTLATIPAADEIHEMLITLRKKGHIRHFGLAGEWQGICGLGQYGTKIGEIVQTAETEWPASDPPDISYGAIARGPQFFTSAAVAFSLARERLAEALARRPHGVVLVSTTRPEHLRVLAQVAAEGVM